MLPIATQVPRPPEVAEVVEEGFVEEIRDDTTGEIHKSADFLRRELRELNRLRGEQEDLLNAGMPRFRCSYCEVGVVLRLSSLRRWYFRHVEEDGSCRYQTKGFLSQNDLDARREPPPVVLDTELGKIRESETRS
jgi:hypothetical protein